MGRKETENKKSEKKQDTKKKEKMDEMKSSAGIESEKPLESCYPSPAPRHASCT